jgi:hypothetical protein
MYRSVVFGCVAALAWGGIANVASAQSYDTHDAVIEQCAAVAAAEGNSDDNPLSGYCLNATGTYLSVLLSQNLTIDEFGSELSLLVVDLAKLVVKRECKPESEIAQAIKLVANASPDSDQVLQIKQIYGTIGSCSFGVTAAIYDFADDPSDLDPFVPESLASPGGLPASLS